MAATDQTLRDSLLAQSPVWLTEQLLGAAQEDRALLARLQVEASGGDGGQIVRRELDRAIRVADLVEDEDAATYIDGVDAALELLAGMVGAGHPDEAIELAEHAMDLLAESIDQVDDGGETHGSLFHAHEIHVRACMAGNPDPTALAHRLFTRATADTRHHTILAVAERAAQADGVDAVVDVLARDLRSARCYQRVCDELVRAGRVDQALEWARPRVGRAS